MVERAPGYLEHEDGALVSRKPLIYKPNRILKAPEPNIKVAVSVPTYGDWHPQFGFSIAKLMLFTGVTLVADGIVDLKLNMIEGTYLDKARNDLAEQAIRTGSTHILWLDADMKFPQDALMRLLAHDKDIVGANYCYRRFPLQHVAYKHVSTESNEQHVRLRTTEQSQGLEQVDALGFGCLLMNVNIFAKLSGPWFEVNPQYGEDVYFCLKAKEAGLECWVDHDLSKELMHFGDMGFTYLHAEEWIATEEREKAEAADAA